jgi:phosphoribosylformylglycinamidine cyclo-ligase
VTKKLEKPRKGLTYRAAGVDTVAADRNVSRISKLARKTYGPDVLDGIGGFAGLFALNGQAGLLRRSLKKPVLAACTDGVGTKLKIAFMMNKHDTVGIDLVAMSVNDLVVQGATPLFFLDYIGLSSGARALTTPIVAGVVEGCRRSECALLGGETAELPDLYAPGEYDLAGFCVGIVERDKIIDGSKVAPGDAVIGLRSSGLHSNGYSLARKALFERAGLKIDERLPECGRTVGEELLEPTIIYAAAVREVLRHYKVKEIVKALANITGSGLPGNVPRTLPRGVTARIRKGAWPVPPIFECIQKAGEIAEEEMYATFNMGVGMTLVCPAFNVAAIRRTLKRVGVTTDLIGEIAAGKDRRSEPVVEFI